MKAKSTGFHDGKRYKPIISSLFFWSMCPRSSSSRPPLRSQLMNLLEVPPLNNRLLLGICHSRSRYHRSHWPWQSLPSRSAKWCILQCCSYRNQLLRQHFWGFSWLDGSAIRYLLCQYCLFPDWWGSDQRWRGVIQLQWQGSKARWLWGCWEGWFFRLFP